MAEITIAGSTTITGIHHHGGKQKLTIRSRQPRNKFSHSAIYNEAPIADPYHIATPKHPYTEIEERRIKFYKKNWTRWEKEPYEEETKMEKKKVNDEKTISVGCLFIFHVIFFLFQHAKSDLDGHLINLTELVNCNFFSSVS